MNIITDINKIKKCIYQESKLNTRIDKISKERKKRIQELKVKYPDGDYENQELPTSEDLCRSHKSMMLNNRKPQMKEHKIWTKTCSEKDINFSESGEFTVPNIGNSLSRAIVHIKIAPFKSTNCRYIKKANNRILEIVKVYYSGKLIQNYSSDLYNFLGYCEGNKKTENVFEVYNKLGNKLLYSNETNTYEIMNTEHDEYNLYVPIFLGNDNVPVPLKNTEIKISFTVCDQDNVIFHNSKSSINVSILECNLYTEHCDRSDKIWENVIKKWPLTTMRVFRPHYFNIDKSQETYSFDVSGLISSINIGVRPEINGAMADHWFSNHDVDFTSQKILIGNEDNDLIWYNAKIPQYKKIVNSLSVRLNGINLMYDIDPNFFDYIDRHNNISDFGNWYRYDKLEYRNEKEFDVRKKNLSIKISTHDNDINNKYILVVMIEKIIAYDF